LAEQEGALLRLLIETSAATLLKVAADPRHLGAEIGFLSVLPAARRCRVRIAGRKAIHH
jgi:hypothetical protein